MNIMCKFCHTLTFLLFGLVSYTVLADDRASSSNHIELSAFSDLPDTVGLDFNPSGTWLAYRTHKEGRVLGILQNVATGERKGVPAVEEADVMKLIWANDNTALIVYTFRSKLRRGMASETRLFAYNIETDKIRRVVAPGENLGREFYAQYQHDILSLLPDEPNHILMSLDGNRDGQSEVRRIDIRSGRFRSLVRPRSGIQHWMLDQDNEVRFGYGYRERERWARLKNSEGDWQSINKVDWIDKFDLHAFTEDPKIAYVTGIYQAPRKGLYKLNVDTGEVVETVFEHETVDVGGLVYHPRTGKPAGVGYTTDLFRVKYFDKQLDGLHKRIKKLMPGDSVRFRDQLDGKEAYVIYVANSMESGSYYYLDMDTKEMAFVAANRNRFFKDNMSETREVLIPVSGDMEIPAFLTLPRGYTQEDGPIPSIVMPHGGPQSRSSAAWAYDVQFLANRGYAVLQPNFRGSTGYGAQFEAMGKHQWGGLMQDDITAAARWMMAEGYADPDRTCISGGSFGGYAAIFATIATPDLFECAISLNGVMDVGKLKRQDRRRFIGGRVWTKTMGLESVDDDEISPYQRRDEIKIPVLLIAAKDDARVDYRQSRDLAKRLKK